MKLEKKERIKKDIGKRIEFIRNEKKMTKEDFAKLINISGQHLGRIIVGEKGLSIEKINKIKNNINNINDIINTLI